jgi:hypothetical protein
MTNLLKNEFGKLKKPILFTIAFLTIAAIVLTGTLYTGYSLHYDLEAWEVGRELIDFLFPLFVVIPICWLMYYERKDNFLVYNMPRVSKPKYMTAKWIVAAVCAFAILFIPYFLSAVFALYIKPPIGEIVLLLPPGETPIQTPFAHIFLDMFVNAPLLYAFLLSLWKSVIGVMVMSMGFVLSLYVKNVFVILTGPFIYSILENFIWSILRIPQYRLVASFEPTSVMEELVTPLSLAVGPLLLLAFIVCLWLFFSKLKKKSVYEV